MAVARLLLILVAGLLLFGLQQVNAAVDDLERQVEQMADLVLGMLHVDQFFAKAAAADPDWPLGLHAAQQKPTELACVRAELAALDFRAYEVAEARANAAADPQRFAEDLALLTSEVGRQLLQLYAARFQAVLSGRTPPNINESLPGAPEPVAQAVAAILNDTKHRALRELIGTAGSLQPVMRKCGIEPITAIVTTTVPPVTEMTFAARCSNPLTITKDATAAAPRSDPRRPLMSPAYPAASRLGSEQGRTVVDVYVTEEGLVQAARLRSSSGFRALDEEALKATGTWQLIPGQLNGKAACMWGSFTLTFKLEEEAPPAPPQ